MPFTVQNVTGMASALKKGMGVLLSPQEVEPYGYANVDPIMVKLAVGQRRTASTGLTGGADQEAQFATIDAVDWDAKIDRQPQKGDIIHWAGRRFAVETNQIIAPAGILTLYKCRLRG